MGIRICHCAQSPLSVRKNESFNRSRSLRGRLFLSPWRRVGGFIIPYKTSAACASAFAAAALVAGISPALSAVTVGARTFPATLTIDDPGVSDEFTLPIFTHLINADSSVETDIGGSYAKRITENLGIVIGDTYTHLNNPLGNGWQNFTTALQYQVFTNPEHEFIVTVETVFEWGHTGNATIGARPFTSVFPAFTFGKGFGDLQTTLNFLRPFAVTGQMGVSFSTHPIDVTVGANNNIVISQDPTIFHWGFSLQYSLPYMNSNGSAIDTEFFRHLIPIVECHFSTPIANIGPGGNGNSHVTTGTVSPGIIYADTYYQVGVEALIPVNSQSGKLVGVIASVDFYLDDILPDSLGRPVFALESSQAAKSPF
jgi:hypothetical protein